MTDVFALTSFGPYGQRLTLTRTEGARTQSLGLMLAPNAVTDEAALTPIKARLTDRMTRAWSA